MGWIIKALAKIILSILDGLMAWTASLITELKLDIGMSKNGSPWEAINPKTAGENGLLAQTFPGASSYCTYFMMIAIIIIFTIMIFKLYQGFISPFTDAEPPGGVAFRAVAASVGAVCSYSIFVTFEQIFNIVFEKFMNQFNKTITDKNGESIFNQFKEKSSYKAGGTTSKAEDAAGQTGSYNKIDQFWGNEKLIDPKGKNITGAGSGDGLTILIIEAVIGVAIITSFVKLVLEIYQRYVTLGLLFYTCPLAFAMMASKSTKNILSNWFMMLFSQFILMCMNLFFVGCFIGAFMNILQNPATKGGFFASDIQFVTTMLLLLGWLTVGQRVDEYMRGLGLSVANTGAGLGGALLAGAGTAMMAARTMGRLAGKVPIPHPSSDDDSSIGKTIAEKTEDAINDLNESDVGEMSTDDFKQNVIDRNGLDNVKDESGVAVNAANVDWDASAEESGKGAQVLMDSEGNPMSISTMEGSEACNALSEAGLMRDVGNGTFVPVTHEDFERMDNELLSNAKAGRLKSAVDKNGYDGTKYDSYKPIDGGYQFTNKETGATRSVNTADYYRMKGGEKGPFENIQQAHDALKTFTNTNNTNGNKLN